MAEQKKGKFRIGAFVTCASLVLGSASIAGRENKRLQKTGGIGGAWVGEEQNGRWEEILELKQTRVGGAAG